MKALNEFNEERQELLEQAIARAEKMTSGEIRLHIEDHCKEDVLDHATFIFDELQMEKTRERNGVLIYLAYLDHKFAILGDVGINQKVPENFWEDIKENAIAHFSKGDFMTGLLETIHQSGKSLSAHFPLADDDTDELDNTISFGGQDV